MKVSTDIHSGALAQTAAQTVDNLTGQVNEFLSAAQDQAASVTGQAAGIFTGFWDAVRGALG